MKGAQQHACCDTGEPILQCLLQAATLSTDWSGSRALRIDLKSNKGVPHQTLSSVGGPIRLPTSSRSNGPKLRSHADANANKASLPDDIGVGEAGVASPGHENCPSASGSVRAFDATFE